MNNLNLIIEILKKQTDTFSGDYFIPAEWNYMDYSEYTTNEKNTGEINVNPYAFMIFCLEKMLVASDDGNKKQLSAALDTGLSSINLTKCIIYSMLPRMFTAWNHYNNDNICSGTLLKAIVLIPYLKQFGINIIYLLPVFKYSNMYKKGELGCPYAIKDIYKLDEGLHDELLGAYDEKILEVQFKAFVEVCHILDVKVMIDFVFRTVARDSDLIAEHPDWFYWINLKYKDTFCAPHVKNLKKPTSVVNDFILEKLYKSEDAKKCLTTFKSSPDAIDSTRWQNVKTKYLNSKKNILEMIESEFGITTVPGFSDVVNDTQPAWSDATYLKFYSDVSDKTKQYITRDQPSYILQDGVKLSCYRGLKINKELWEYISNVIPYYQTQFGIDGARIDMGHALPPELNKDIVAKAKTINKNFILWSEEFNENNSIKAQEDGFNFITSRLWGEYKHYKKPSFTKKLYKILLLSTIPVTGAIENADTPRSALRYSKQILEHLIFINYFIPNAVPLINNGQELMEIQPMNLGLDNTEEGRLVLDKNDPMYGKLGFFDNYQMHWQNTEMKYVAKRLKKGFELRTQFIDLISRKELMIIPEAKELSGKTIFIGYYDSETGKNVFLLSNRDMEQGARVNLKRLLPEDMRTKYKYIKIVHTNLKQENMPCDVNKILRMKPGEIIIACMGAE